MSIYHLNAGSGPFSSTASLDNVGFATKPESDYNKAFKVDSPNLAALLGVAKGEQVFVATDEAAKALAVLNNDDTLSMTKATVYDGPPSRMGTIGDFLWGTKVREN